jgi:hypothetical protein
MNKPVLLLLGAFSSVIAFSGVLAGSANLPVGKVTRLMTKDLPDFPGKEGMVEIVDSIVVVSRSADRRRIVSSFLAAVLGVKMQAAPSV